MTVEETEKVKVLLKSIDAMFEGDANWSTEDVVGYTEVAALVGHNNGDKD